MCQYPHPIRLVYGFTLTSCFLFSESFHVCSQEWTFRKPVMPLSLQHKFIRWRPKSSPIVPSSRRCDPVQIFPLEIVWMIFHHLLDADKNCWHIRRLISLVSKSWRNAVYTNPLFWQFIKFDLGLFTQAYLRVLNNQIIRSQDVPLFVTISSATDPPDQRKEFPIAALDSIFFQSSRIRVLSIKFPLSHMHWKPNVKGRFSHLEKLKLNRSRSDFMFYIFDNMSPMQLTYLALVNVSISMKKIHNILAACRNLESIRIIFGFGERLVRPPHYLLLPKLRCLTLGGQCYLPDILSCLRAPNLSSLAISHSIYMPFWFSSLNSLLLQTKFLKELTLYGAITDSERSLINMLKHCSRLTRLFIRNPAPDSLIEDETFRLLTRQQGSGCALLPDLEQLVIVKGIRIEDHRVIVDMIKSRSLKRSLSGPQLHPPELKELKFVELDECERMPLRMIRKVGRICRKRGVMVAGSFVGLNAKTNWAAFEYS